MAFSWVLWEACVSVFQRLSLQGLTGMGGYCEFYQQDSERVAFFLGRGEYAEWA